MSDSLVSVRVCRCDRQLKEECVHVRGIESQVTFRCDMCLDEEHAGVCGACHPPAAAVYHQKLPTHIHITLCHPLNTAVLHDIAAYQ